MSLQIWLPLDGSAVVNRGVAPIEITENTLTYSDTGGKISPKCPQDGKLVLSTGISPSSKAFSVAFWLYPTGSSRFQLQLLCDHSEQTTVFDDFQWSANTSTGELMLWGFRHLKGQNMALARDYLALQASSWNHIVITYATNYTMYALNGTTIRRWTTQQNLRSLDAIKINCNYNSQNKSDFVQDFRLYDHALSEREIKQLSQGLMVHYPLADNMVEPTTNLLTYPTPTGSKPSHEWDAELHVNAINVRGWTDGWNGGVSSPTTGYHARWELIDGLPTAVFPNLNPSDPDKAGRWLGINNSGSPIQSKLAPGVTYTVSFDARSTVESHEIRAGLYYWLTSGTSQAFNDGQAQLYLTTKWKRYSFTKTTSTSMNTSKAAYLYLYGHYGTAKNGIAQIRNIQLELKDHATAYTPTTRESILSDCSGNCKHGTIVGSCTSLSDSARYSNCLYISDGRTNYGQTPTLNMPTEQITMSCWYKTAEKGYSDYQIVMSSSGEHYEMSITPSGTLRTGFRINGTRKCENATHTSVFDGKWHMLTTTYDGATIKRYVDGALVGGSTAAAGTLSGAAAPLLIGNYNGTTYGAKNASISDVRIYCTALSDADIETLYKSSAALLDDGSVAAYQFNEEATNLKFAANGLCKASEISEIPYTAGLPTKVMPDGSAWARIYWLDLNNQLSVFANADEVAFCDDQPNRFSRMGLVDKWKKSEQLPDGYTTIEYIESTGTQYINTQYYWTSENTKIEMDATVVSNGTSQSLFGSEEAYSGSSRYFSGIPHGTNGTYGYYVGSNSPLASGIKTCNMGERFTLECQTATIARGDVNGDGRRSIIDVVLLNAAINTKFELTEAAMLNADCDLDGQITDDDVSLVYSVLQDPGALPGGETATPENLFIAKVNGVDIVRKIYSGSVQTYKYALSTHESKGIIYIFANHNSGSSNANAIQHIGGMKLYSFKMYDNGILVRDFIPVKNEAGQVGLWDRVTRTFFANAGTGEFVAGPDFSRDEYEFMLTYPSTGDGKYNRWIQSNSPNVPANEGTGHVKIHTDLTPYAYPLTLCNNTSSIYCTNQSNNWWSPIGQLSLYNPDGIPAANGKKEKEVELWVRIDNLPQLTKTSFLDNKFLQASNIYEI